MLYEVVTVGRSIHKQGPFYYRNNARYTVESEKPKYKVGDKNIMGDYEVEVIYIKEMKEKS